MKYVTGMNALKLGDRTMIPGGWHYTAMDWRYPFTLDTYTSPYGTWSVTK